MEAMSLPFADSPHLIARHHSAQAAVAAAPNRATKTLAYLLLLKEAGARGLSDHEAMTATGWPLSSVNSIRNGCGTLVVPAERRAQSPYRPSLYVTCWKRSPEA